MLCKTGIQTLKNSDRGSIRIHFLATPQGDRAHIGLLIPNRKRRKLAYAINVRDSAGRARTSRSDPKLHYVIRAITCCSAVIFQKLQQQTGIKKKKKLFADLETHDVIVCTCQNM